MKRRDFLAAVVAAPFVITTADVLMPVRRIWTPVTTILVTDFYVVKAYNFQIPHVELDGRVTLSDRYGHQVEGDYDLSIFSADGKTLCCEQGRYVPLFAT